MCLPLSLSLRVPMGRSQWWLRLSPCPLQPEVVPGRLDDRFSCVEGVVVLARSETGPGALSAVSTPSARMSESLKAAHVTQLTSSVTHVGISIRLQLVGVRLFYSSLSTQWLRHASPCRSPLRYSAQASSPLPASPLVARMPASRSLAVCSP
jgi:hypothetical protein